MFVLEDNEIYSIVDYNITREVLNSVFGIGLTQSATLAQIVHKYENLLMYQHNSIPAPFMLQETLFMPHLYAVIPPACNVIFKDQILTATVNRDFLQEPTRIVATLENILTSVKTAVPFVYMANTLDNVTDILAKANTPAIACTHDFLTEDECIKGVVSSTCSIGYEKLWKTGTTPEKIGQITNEAARAKFELYISEAVKHHLNMARGRPRSAQLTCTFLPYVVPGFPCLVEDHTGPFFGIVSTVQHSLPCTGRPSTSITVTFMRETYRQAGNNRTPPIPIWLNAKYGPEQINGTYVNKINLGSAMVPNSSIISSFAVSAMTSSGTPPQVDMDALAAQVISTPSYGADFTQFLGMSTGTIAETLRKAPPGFQELAFLKYQNRTGIYLSAYCAMHDLGATGTLPVDLTGHPGIKTVGHPLFAHPEGLTFVPNTYGTAAPGIVNTLATLGIDIPTDSPAEAYIDSAAPAGIYGNYNATGNALMPLRQNAAYLIQQALNKHISLEA
jgi:hypothetical protein